MHPRRDAMGGRPELLIANDGPVERRFLGPAAVLDPCSDAARWRLVLDAATDLGIVEALQDYLLGCEAETLLPMVPVPVPNRSGSAPTLKAGFCL